jgi:hypothetical protein
MEDTTWKCEPRKSLALARGLTMRLLALVLLALVLFVLVSAWLGGCQQTGSTRSVTHSSAVPGFIQEGKVYEFEWLGTAIGTGILHLKLRVLKIRPEGWVQAQILETGGVVWINLNQVFAVEVKQ